MKNDITLKANTHVLIYKRSTGKAEHTICYNNQANYTITTTTPIRLLLFSHSLKTTHFKKQVL